MEKNADRHNHHPEFITATSAKFLNQKKNKCIKENGKAWHWPTNIDISEIGLYNPLRGNNLESTEVSSDTNFVEECQFLKKGTNIVAAAQTLHPIKTRSSRK